MTGFPSKKAAALDKLTVDREQLEHWLQSLKDIDALHHSQEPESVDAQKAIADMGQALAQPEQEPVAWIERDMQCDDFDPDSVTCEKPTIAADGWEWVALFTHPPQRTWVGSGDLEDSNAYLTQPAQAEQERNFCPRCGKRTADLTVIHTCTPPQEST